MACRDVNFYKGPSLFGESQSRKRREPIHGWRRPSSFKEKMMKAAGRHGVSFFLTCTRSSTHSSTQRGSSLLDLIKECGREKDLSEASSLHAVMLAKGMFSKNTSLGNALISTYAKCGALMKAQELFNQLPARNIVTWNALIAAYTHHGSSHDALRCFQCMQDQGLTPNAVTFICILKACGSIKAIEKGEEIHAEIGRQGLLEKDAVLGTALLDMYVKCGALLKAQAVFDTLPSRNEVTWNVLMGAYAEHGLNEEVLRCFRHMQGEGLAPTAATFKRVLKACASLRVTEKGEEIHNEIDKQGLLEKDSALGTALVDMYAKCGALSKARGVFDKLPMRSISTWTALIHGYAEHGFGNEALIFFSQMQEEGVRPDAVTYVSILRACGSIGAVQRGEEIHKEISRQGLLEENNVVSTALVDMYCECGALAKAQEVLNTLLARTTASCNALISGYVKHGLADEAIYCFQKMSEEGIAPNPITYTCILRACGIVGAAEMGEDLHHEIRKKQLLEKDMLLGIALLDMYVNCGVHTRAQEVMEELPGPNIALWKILMAGYAQVGAAARAFDMFYKMVSEGMQPDPITFIILLTACSHTGLVEEAEMWFKSMSTAYRLSPTLEHWTCMVDIFSRAGLFEKSISMIEMVPPADRLLLWSSLMGACQQWVNVEVAQWAFEHAVLLDKKSVTAYICMRNIYAAAGMQQEAAEVEALRMKNGAWKSPESCLWSSLNGYAPFLLEKEKNWSLSKYSNRRLEAISNA